MKTVLVHYHLRAGGVTQVMLNQTAALREAGEDVLVLSAEPPPDAALWGAIPIALVPRLHYDRYRPAEETPDTKDTAARHVLSLELAASVEKAIHSHWPGGADLIHVHNPLIRKNCLLLGALKELAKRSPLLLQNHDLAEDFRPDVYAGEEYPENCHYGVINSRDYRFLLDAGLKPEGLHLLPNEVRTLCVTPDLPKTTYLYPVRGIRRKNIGEALFLSLFLDSPDTSIAITQPPTTEQDSQVYNQWKTAAADLNLPLAFEAGLKSSFADVMGSARAVITTSVKEGFGFSFLEPWTAGIAVTGRRIDSVCRDFENAGVRFDKLYQGIQIPAEYAEPEKLRQKTEIALTQVYAAFGLSLPPRVSAELEAAFTSRDFFDFGIMDEAIQENVLRLAASDKTIRNRIKAANPFLETLADWNIDPAATEENRSTVLSAYSREKTLDTILDAYRKSLVPVTQSISRPRLLELYLDPAHIFLVGISPGRVHELHRKDLTQRRKGAEHAEEDEESCFMLGGGLSAQS